MMNELFLQKIWNLQYFDKTDLKTECGKVVEIISPGKINSNAGPDFLNARIRLNEIDWAGNIEIHLKTSDWFTHQHHHDQQYSNVILHVVWLNDLNDFFQSPVLTINNRIIELQNELLSEIIHTNKPIPCFPFFNKNYFTKEFKNLLLASRFKRKCYEINRLVKSSSYDWKQVFWILFCKNMGYPVNEDAFERLSMNLPFKIIQKYQHDHFTIEALLFGMSGLLEKDNNDNYPNQLKVQFHRLKKLHSLRNENLPIRFLRMRPINFPTIRLAQLAALLSSDVEILNKLLLEDNMNNLRLFFKVHVNDYWKNHYVFGKVSDISSKKIGDTLIDSILINTIIPLQIIKSSKQQGHMDLSIARSMLDKLKPESNYITKYFSKNELTADSASDTQAMLELYNSFCSQKKCRECIIAYEIMKNQ